MMDFTPEELAVIEDVRAGRPPRAFPHLDTSLVVVGLRRKGVLSGDRIPRLVQPEEGN